MKRNIIQLLCLSLLTMSINAAEQNHAEQERAPARFVQAQEKVALKEKMAQSEAEKEEAAEGDIQSKGIFYYPRQHLSEFHFLRSVAYTGESVELEDGSLWKVRWSDYYIPLSWFSTDVLKIQQGAWYSSYDYEIHNKTNGTKIEANLIASPILYGANSYWILSVDIYSHQIVLNDGSIWVVYDQDFSTLISWAATDHLIIGTNNGIFTSGSYPNILINGCLNTCVRAACIN